MEKKVTEAEIKRVIKEYIERMFKLFETNRGANTDDRIDCPRCGCHRGVEFSAKGWVCLWKDCPFRFSEELMPPTPTELREFFDMKKTEEMVHRCLNS